MIKIVCIKSVKYYLKLCNVNNTMSITENIKQVLENDQKLRYICNNPYFMMRQLSDATEQNIFDHIVFVDSEPIVNVFDRSHLLVHNKNTTLEDKHMQMFISKKIYSKNKTTFEDAVTQGTYKVVNSYNEIFNGFIKTENFLIMVNGEHFNGRYPVCILIDSRNQNIKIKHVKKNLEFYGFFIVGYLINPGPYLEHQLLSFEEENNISITSITRQIILSQPVINYKGKLYYIDLSNINSETLTKFDRKTKRINNFELIKNINEATEETKEEQIAINNDFVSHMCDGFLYLGIVNYINVPHNNVTITKQTTKLFLLINFVEQPGINLIGTLWERTIINNNVEKMLRLYTDETINNDINAIVEAEKEINLSDPSQIIHSMNFVQDL